MELPEVILAIILGIVAVIGGYAITAAYARAKAAQLEADKARADLSRERSHRQDAQMGLRDYLDELNERVGKLEPSGKKSGESAGLELIVGTLHDVSVQDHFDELSLSIEGHAEAATIAGASLGREVYVVDRELFDEWVATR